MRTQDSPITRAWLVLLVVIAFSSAAWARPAREFQAAAGSGAPRGSRTKTIEKTIAAKGRSISLESTASDIIVRASDGGDVHLLAVLEYWSKDSDWMERVEQEFDVEVRESANDIAFQPVSLPEPSRRGVLGRVFGRGEIHYSIEISLEVPRGSSIAVDNRYGDVSTQDVGGPVEINNSSGTVSVSGAAGTVEVENSYGDATISQVEGSVEVVVTSGRVEVDHVSGDVDVSNRYGEVSVADVGGDLDLESSSSKLEVERVGNVGPNGFRMGSIF